VTVRCLIAVTPSRIVRHFISHKATVKKAITNTNLKESVYNVYRVMAMAIKTRRNEIVQPLVCLATK